MPPSTWARRLYRDSLFIDENVSRRIAGRLARDGHTVVHDQDVALGKPDTDVLALAYSLGAIVVPEDTDFGDLVMRLHLPSAGVILLRLSRMTRAAQPDFIARAIVVNAPALHLESHIAHIPSSRAHVI
jgi:predicted nuclease of predicted toxin-antitoxin system